MQDGPKLQREAELPRPRSSGAAIVAVSALAMFTAIGASAFVVRARMERSHCRQAASAARFYAAARAGEAARARALARTGALRPQFPPPLSPTLAPLHPDAELRRAPEKTGRGASPAVNARLARLRYLLPEAQLPVTMARCAPSAVWVDFSR